MDNTATLQRLQQHLVQRVQATTDVDKLVHFLIFIDELPISEDSAKRIFHPIRRGMTVEMLKKEQNFKGTDWEKADAWVKELDISSYL